MNYGKRKLPPTPAPSVRGAESEVGSSTEGVKDEVVKRQFRNQNEKKRRDLFNQLITQLSAIVYNPSENNKKADKTTVLEQAIRFLHNHRETESALKENISYSWKPSFLSADEFTYLLLEAMDCSTVTTNPSGVIESVSDNIERKLGFTVDTEKKTKLGNYLTDQSTVSKLLSASKTDSDKLLAVEALISNDPVSETGSKFQAVDILCVPDSVDDESSSLYNFIIQLKYPSLTDECLAPPGYSFKAKYSLEWKILHIDNKSAPVLGHQPFEILGTSGYDYYHPDDLENIASAHRKLLRSGCCKTPLHRMYTKGQGWVWLQADLYLCYNHWNGKPELIECIYTVPSKQSIELYKQEGQYPEQLHEPPAMKQRRTNFSSISTAPSTDIPFSGSATDLFFDNLVQSNNSLREKNYGRQKSKVAANQLIRTGRPSPPPQLNPVQQKLHSQLLAKYKTLKATLDLQHQELNQLMDQLNIVSGGGGGTLHSTNTDSTLDDTNLSNIFM